jgi:hypothetical protein
VSKGDYGCDTDPKLLKWILKKHAPELLDAPVFVASDHQRPDLETAFAKAGAVFYRGKCHSFDKQCMVIDAEIAARSAYFYGLHLSTAAQNIERFRRQRDNGTPNKQMHAFPHLKAGYDEIPTPEEWTPAQWRGGTAPESYFASKPKENMDQVAATAAPVPAPTNEDDDEVEDEGDDDEGVRKIVPEYEQAIEDTSPRKTRDGATSKRHTANEASGSRSGRNLASWFSSSSVKLAASSSTHMAEMVAAAGERPGEEEGASCRRVVDGWMAPLMWLLLFLIVACPRVQRRGQYVVLRLGWWSGILNMHTRRWATANKDTKTKK